VNRAVVQRLRAELQSDLAAFSLRVEALRDVRPDASDAGACALAAVALHHAYGSMEAALARIMRLLEGEELQGIHWHQALLDSSALDVPGVRPPLLSRESLATLREPLGFRHFFRHAYAVTLDAARLDALGRRLLEGAPSIEADVAAVDRWLAGVADGLTP
jgi:hypothetical protein